jgi:hypothetical protein
MASYRIQSGRATAAIACQQDISNPATQTFLPAKSAAGQVKD